MSDLIQEAVNMAYNIGHNTPFSPQPLNDLIVAYESLEADKRSLMEFIEGYAKGHYNGIHFVSQQVGRELIAKHKENLCDSSTH